MGFFFIFVGRLQLTLTPPPQQKKPRKKETLGHDYSHSLFKDFDEKKILNLVIFPVSVYVDFIIVSSLTQLLFYQSAITCTILFSHDN